MSSTVSHSVRFRADEMARFKEAAKARRIPLNRWIRDACDKMADLEKHLVVSDGLNDEVIVAPRARGGVLAPRGYHETVTKPSKRPRTTMCEHRLPPGAFCKHCD